VPLKIFSIFQGAEHKRRDSKSNWMTVQGHVTETRRLALPIVGSHPRTFFSCVIGDDFKIVMSAKADHDVRDKPLAP
jgi:hypothetical protein